MSKTFTFVCIVLLISLTSCIKEKFDPEKLDISQNFESGLATPVGYSTLEIEKFVRNAIEDNLLIVGPDGLLSLLFSQSVSTGTMDNLLSFPPLGIENHSILNETGSPIFLPVGGQGIIFTDTIFIPVSFSQSSANPDSIIILSGFLQSEIDAPGITGSISYDFPGLLNAGSAFSESSRLSDPGLNEDLSGYTLITEKDPSGINVFAGIVTIHLESTSTPIAPDSPILTIAAGFNNLRFETIYGDLDGFNIAIPPIQLNPGAYTNVIEGQFSFADPKIELLFSNSIGVPLGISFNPIDAILRDDSQIILTGSGIGDTTNPLPIKYPSPGQVNQLIHDTLRINRGNSNLPDFFSSNTNLININANARIGPPEGSETVFIRHDSRIDMIATLEVPLWGRAEYFVLMDTIAFDFMGKAIPMPEELEKLTVRLNITNSFPVSVIPQLYILNANNVLTDSLFTEELILEGAIDKDGDGKVDAEEKLIDILIPRSKFEHLQSIKHLVMKGRFSTTGFPPDDVKFFLTYNLKYELGIIAQLKINTGK